MEKTLIILRGIPGCGKSTFARMIADEPGCICTADDYFMKNGQYLWEPSQLGAAHSACVAKCERLMQMQVANVILANTSTTQKEMNPYYEIAQKYDYKVFSLIVENRHGGINEHNVPEASLQKMKERFDIQL